MKKLTSAKLKAHLAMAAFVLVATAMMVMTTVGVLSYMTTPLGVPVNAQEANAVGAPFGAAAASSGAILIQGK